MDMAAQGGCVMSAPSQQPNSWDYSAASNYFANGAHFLGLWNPFLSMAQLNGHAADGIGTLFSEWQNFVSHRLRQDLLFMQQLTQCASPDQVAAAYADFWQKAFTEYSNELTTMSNLLTGITNKAISQAHSASQEVAKISTPARAAE
jgi:hypothetical protein